MRHITHPGPVRDTRRELVSCDGRAFEVVLAADMPLETAVAQALAPFGFDSVWLEVRQASVKPLTYVGPAHARDDTHVAWYSEERGFAEGVIDRLGMIVGQHRGQQFIHGHGLWQGENAAQTMGHVLPALTRLSQPAKATGFGLHGARFDRRLDTETQFECFHADQVAHSSGDFALLRLMPNQDLTDAMVQACHDLGWDGAHVYGLGSVIGVTFENGTGLEAAPTEFLITEAVITDAAALDIAITGVEEGQVLEGRLQRGANPVLITAELILKRTSA